MLWVGRDRREAKGDDENRGESGLEEDQFASESRPRKGAE